MANMQENFIVGPAVCASMLDASHIVKKNLLQDREVIDLATQLNIASIYSGVSSGLSKDDYPTLDGIHLPTISDVRRIPLPPELVEQFGHMQCNCIMGVFPQIGRAWLTVDSDIFVWRYIDGEDLAYFDGLSETILSVALVHPKPGIFREHIKYLLVLTTPLDIVLLGVSFDDDDINNEMHLLPDPLFTLSSDGTYLVHTVGTVDGRIFCGGKDGCLYEIVYQASGGWFSRKCTKINHSRSRLSFLLPSVVNVWLSEEDAISQVTVDDTRNILYTRSDQGTISVYDLGNDGQGLSCVTQMRLDTIQKRAHAIAPTIEPSNLKEIIHIAPITLRESRFLSLVAVTQAGVRLYFMACSVNVMPTTDPKLASIRPGGLYLVHVRLPSFFTSSSIQRPTAVHAAHYNSGALLLGSRTGDDGMLWCIDRDMYAFDRLLKETQANFELDGQAWAIAEIPSPMSLLTVAALPPDNNQGLPPDPPIHTVQHVQKPPEYVVITSQGCHVFYKLRPVDQLRHVLETTTDPDSELVETFFRLYKGGEAICCCIIIAMCAVPTDLHIAERALAVFLHHGGLSRPRTGHESLPQPTFPPFGPMSPIQPGQQRQPQMNATARTAGGLPVFSTPMPGTAAAPTFFPPGSQQHPASIAPTTDAIHAEIYHSERQHGVFKMFSRILRPVWEGKLVKDFVVSEDGKQRCFVVSRVDEEVIGLVLENLTLFHNFVGKHCLTQVPLRDLQPPAHDRSAPRQFSHYPFGRHDTSVSSAQHEAMRRNLAETAAAELASMQYLFDLIQKTVEVLALWRLLLHHQLHVVFDSLEKQHQAALKVITFHDFVLTGDALCSALISTLISKYIDDNSTVDALSNQLRDVCPSLYSPDDAVCSKASELLNAARGSVAMERAEQLEEAARLFQHIAHSVHLPVVMQQFLAVRHYTGAIDLCLRAAQQRDPEDLAIKLYLSSQGPNDTEVDPEFRKAYLARAECYKCIIDLLDELMTAAQSHPQAPSVPLQPGPPKKAQSTSGSADDTSLAPLSPEEAQHQADSCLQRALSSNDELLHVTIYEWMMRKRMTGQLLRISSPYVESFLRRVAASQEDAPAAEGTSGSDLLWQYYERSGQHTAAAEILANLAERPGADRSLAKRIECLSRAKMNAKSVTSVTGDSVSGGQLLNELEEKLEVAQIQLQALEQLKNLNKEDSVNELNFRLVDVTTLYRDYAEPFQLAECKLAIVHVAGLHDPALVEALWQNIIESELTKPTSAENSQPAILSHKVIELGKRYLTSQRYFPLESIVLFLEKISCGRGWDVDWVVSTILQVGVPLQELLAVYGTLHAQKLPCWVTFGNPHHLLTVINALLRLFVDDPLKYVTSGQRRRHLINRSLDSIAVHLVELRSAALTGEYTDHMIALLRRTQASLETLQAERDG